MSRTTSRPGFVLLADKEWLPKERPGDFYQRN
jgi:hypothetical protein